MQFVKEFVPDNRYQSGQRPVTVTAGRFTWMMWNFAKNLQKMCEKRFKEVVVETPPTTTNTNI